MVSNNLLFSSLFGEMVQFDEHIFQMGWFNHQLVHFASLKGFVSFLFGILDAELFVSGAGFWG